MAIGYALHDDQLGMRLAQNILHGRWLGDYNVLTLLKEPFYPLFLAANFVLGLPLLFTQQVLYVFACILMIYALRPLITSKLFLIMLYVVLLFNPMSYDGYIACRLYRVAIYPSLVLLSFACLFGFYARRNEALSKLFIWAIGLGISFSAFWHNREEGIWLVPSLVLMVAVTGIQVFREKPEEWKQRIVCCALPFFIFGFVNTTIKTLNLMHYGVFVSSEHKAASFKAAYGALSRVELTNWGQYLGMPLEARERIYTASPAFDELRPLLEGPLRGWTIHGREYMKAIAPEECETAYPFAWWEHVFREAVQLAGYCGNGTEAMSYYSRVAHEINKACDEGRLDCLPKRDGFVPPLRKEYFWPFLHHLKKAVFIVVGFQGFSGSQPRASTGSNGQLTLFRDISRESLSPLEHARPSALRHQAHLNGQKIKVLNRIGSAYQVLVPYIVALAVCCYLMSLATILKRKSIDFLVFFNSLLFAELLALISMVAFLGTSIWPTMTNALYLSPCFAITLLFACLSVYHFATLWNPRPRHKSTNHAPGC
jgi:hypothetical protein